MKFPVGVSLVETGSRAGTGATGIERDVSWVVIVEEEEEEVAEEHEDEEDEEVRVRLEFFRVPPPIGTFRRVPPCVQYRRQDLQK